MAIGTGTDVAIESSDITLISGALGGLVTAVDLSRATMRNIHQNLAFAFLYNGLGIPIAAGVLYPALGLTLSPMIAAGAMALSSLSVVANANRLRGFQPRVLPETVQVPNTNPVVEVGGEPSTDDIDTGTAASPTPDEAVDPVCGMTIDPSSSAESVPHDGHTYHFCSEHCASSFRAEPTKYTTSVRP